MITRLTYLKDAVNNNYIGVKIYQDIIEPYLTELKDILGSEYEVYKKNQQDRDHNAYHITVINVMEYNSLSKKTSEFVNSLDSVFDYEIDDLQLMGVGTATKNDNRTYFVVCKSDKLQSIRQRYGLPEQDFHITLGFKWKDCFGVRKNVVLEKKSKFLQLLAQEFLKKENFEFLKRIDNYSDDKDLEIIPISISDKYLKIKVGDFLIDIGLTDDNKFQMFTRYKDDKNTTKMPTTELLRYLKNKI